MGTEEAILYSYDLATLPSILPAFASKKDLIICDEVRPGGGAEGVLWLAGWLACRPAWFTGCAGCAAAAW